MATTTRKLPKTAKGAANRAKQLRKSAAAMDKRATALRKKESNRCGTKRKRTNKAA